jgi:PPOX class probable F420-dependent enzyme
MNIPRTEAGTRAADRLARERVIWLTTVTPDGRPQSAPVWFLWRDGEFLVYSLRGSRRVRNLAVHPRVELHLNATETGGDVVRIEGLAGLDPPAGPSSADADYQAKYRSLIDAEGWTPESFAADYPDAIRIRPTRIRLG